MKINIFFFTVARSDLGIYSNLLKKMKSDGRFNINLVVGSTHKNKIFGNTKNEISKDLYNKIYNLNYIQVVNDTNKTISNIIKSSNNFLKKHKNKIDCIFLLGDRYEFLSIAICAKNLLLPIIHFGGGHTSEGSLDDFYRDCISKTSKIHFVETFKQKKKLLSLGINKNIFITGSPTLEINKKSLLKKKELEKILRIKLEKKIIVGCFHPETTLTLEENLKNLKLLINFLNKINCIVIFTYPNADENFSVYIRYLTKYSRRNIHLHKNLGRKNYFSLLNISDLCIGNSSSGIIDTMSFKLPTINVGNRQKNRLTNANTIHSEFTNRDLYKKFNLAISKKFKKSFEQKKNIYYQKKSSLLIIEHIYKYFKNNKFSK